MGLIHHRQAEAVQLLPERPGQRPLQHPGDRPLLDRLLVPVLVLVFLVVASLVAGGAARAGGGDHLGTQAVGGQAAGRGLQREDRRIDGFPLPAPHLHRCGRVGSCHLSPLSSA